MVLRWENGFFKGGPERLNDRSKTFFQLTSATKLCFEDFLHWRTSGATCSRHLFPWELAVENNAVFFYLRVSSCTHEGFQPQFSYSVPQFLQFLLRSEAHGEYCKQTQGSVLLYLRLYVCLPN